MTELHIDVDHVLTSDNEEILALSARVEKLEAEAVKSLAVCEEYAEQKSNKIFELQSRIEDLETENSRLVSDMKTVNEVTRKTVEHFKATIQRVRDLHAPEDVCANFQHTRLGTVCPDCYTYCSSCQQHYPCPTIRTLEGDTK